MPLTGVRILDLSRLLPGPYATRLLAELGADVIKIEDPRGGDLTRSAPPFSGDGGESALFVQLNRGKRSVTVDLKRPEGQAAVRALARASDVLVDSFRPGVLERLDLAPKRLLDENPRLILCTLTGFGQTGPDRLRAGHDLGFIARSGALGVTGPREFPVVPGFQVADIGAAFVAVSGILAALLERARTGRGRVVDVSLTEAAMAFNISSLGLRGAQAAVARGSGILDGSRPCYGVYRTGDGRFLAVGALEPKFWSAFVHTLGLPDLELRGFDVGPDAEEARRQVEARLAEKTRDEWALVFRDVEACVEPVLDLDELERDPQLSARGNFDATGTLRSPIRLRETLEETGPSRPLGPAPSLGEHTESVLRALDLDPQILCALLEN